MRAENYYTRQNGKTVWHLTYADAVEYAIARKLTYVCDMSGSCAKFYDIRK